MEWDRANTPMNPRKKDDGPTGPQTFHKPPGHSPDKFFGAGSHSIVLQGNYPSSLALLCIIYRALQQLGASYGDLMSGAEEIASVESSDHANLHIQEVRSSEVDGGPFRNMTCSHCLFSEKGTAGSAR